jgi:phosphoribosylaminoimidazolecarboxamide formyltransferase/IMP cyclohydrolase
MTDPVPVRRALLSVSDKTGLAELAQGLAALGIELVSTGGTAALLRAQGLAVREVADLTGFPEILDGRVKTLHPGVHGGLLARRDDPAHMAALAAHGIGPIDLLVVNLYPFEATVARGADDAETVETIDIGGPAMLRAAAKNHAHVAVLTDPEDYAPVLAELRATGGTAAATRRRLAQIAFGRTAAYDAAVATWLAGAIGQAHPRRYVLAGRLAAPLRYGENPHQAAALYLDGSARPGAATARQVQGKALSWNNLNDTDAAWELVSEFGPTTPACVIVKHANPCGVAIGESLAQAYARAHDADRTSAYGGIVALNGRIDGPTAEAITAIFTEVVIAPAADAAALEVFARKPNLRLLLAGGLADPTAPGQLVRPVAGGFLLQDRDTGRLAPADLRVVTRRHPTADELADLMFAWKVAKHVKSNAIVYARGGATVGIGAGQMSRIDSTRIAAQKARDMAAALGLAGSPTEGSVVASDAFFPFPDGLLAAAEAGATAVIQPGGSLRDAEVIAAADAAGLAMVFTGQRHFRH